MNSSSMHEYKTAACILRTDVKLSVPPISIYILSDAQLSPPSFGIFYSVSRYGKYFFQFCPGDLFVKNEDVPCYARPIHGKGARGRKWSMRLGYKKRASFG